MNSLPSPFVARMHERLGAEADAFFEAVGRPRDGLRVNTLRLTRDAFERLSPLTLEPIGEGLPEGCLVGGEGGAGAHPYHAAGLYYLQDPGAMWVGAVVDPRPGEWVLDLAAAPGGKATHLAARLKGEGLLVANDVHRSRAWELVGNLERFGVRNAVVTSSEPRRLADEWGGLFDRVLLDAPCSGESMFHKSEAAREEWSEATIAGCARRQRAILESAAELVAPGGTLVYSTCTFAPEENEQVIAAFLERREGFTVETIGGIPGAERVVERGGAELGAYLWPHRVEGAGHFVTRLRRDGELLQRSDRSPASRAENPAAADVRAFQDFLQEVGLPPMADADRIARYGDSLYAHPASHPDLRRIRPLRTGLQLGTLRKGRFEPAHALALATELAEPGRTVDLEPDDPRVEAYLRGETFRAPGERGWLRVRVGEFALGWGKRTGDTVKNHYPKGLRRHGRAG